MSQDTSSLPVPLQGVLASQRSKLQWLRYRTGQALLQADRLPHQVMFIAEGAVRLIADDPATGPFTLARLGSGDAVGWCGLLRNRPCEAAIAMEPTLVAALPAKLFLELLGLDPSLQQGCLEPNRSELAELLLAWLARQPQRYDDLPGLLAELWRPGALQLVIGEQLGDTTDLDSEYLWLQSAPLPSESPVGSEIKHWKADSASNALPFGGRLIGIQRAALDEALSARRTRPQSADKADGRVHEDLWRQAGDADDLPGPIDPEELGLSSGRRRLPPMHERGDGPLDTALICLQRLASRYRFPFPRDMVEQVLLDCDQRLGGISLLHLGQILESLGLEVRPLNAPAKQLHRLQPPALVKLQDRFLLIEEASPRGLVVADPSRGLVSLSTTELQQLSPDGFQLMLVRPAESADVDAQASRFDLGWFWQVISPYRAQMGLVFIAGFTNKVLEIGFTLAILQIVDVVITTRDLSLLWPIGLMMSLIVVVKGVLALLQNNLIVDLSDRIDTSLGSQVVGHMFRLPMKFFDRRTVGDLSSRFNDLRRVRSFLTGTVINTALDLVFIPLVALVMFAIQPILALVVLSKIPLMFLATWFSSKPIKRGITRRNRAWSRAQGFLVECLSAIRTVKTQNFATQARWQWLQRYRSFSSEDFQLQRLQVFARELNFLIPKGTRLVLMMVGAVLVVQGGTSVGSIFVFLILGGQLASSMIQLSTVSDQYQDARAAMDSLADVLGQKPEDSLASSYMLPLPAIEGRIDLENVSFSYGLTSKRQLDQFSVSLEAGQVIGLVGTSGSGKSTLVQLIDGLYQPEEGRIYIDGTDISKVQIGSLRRQVGFVPQESILFDGTVLDNLRLNMPDAPYEAVIDAARVACAHEFIMKLPDGYNTRVGERGGGLSGGQKQRIAIARMVLQNPRLVILDEATSALDPTTESIVIERLHQRFAGLTLVIVTHRLACLRNADRILMLDSGVLLEDGCWNELMAMQGSFASLAAQQQAHAA
ncbi:MULTISPECIES: peptidase domain-containing ABC transporter [unclassified Synechococcus]|uniref:peptidase domain-containing ABC transporter n=1 Tax=unclassified Synechococcus TaxID=2626047 RepID=UPI0039B0C4B0